MSAETAETAELQPQVTPTPRQVAARRAIAFWLLLMCGLVALMVTVGGLTRLTDSGLSITEWQIVTGTVPPMSEEAWRDEFAKYQRIPEYRLVNRGMSLDEFKSIYWWEWGHRFLGRLIGMAFAAPFLWFAFTRRIERGLYPKLIAMFVLGAAQGALGWFMVMSGLSDRVDVSQYRLTAHLGLAFLIFGYMFWVAVDLLTGGPDRKAAKICRPARLAVFVTAIIYLQVLLGGLVAGLDAGLTYNTWPLMDGRFIPKGFTSLQPWFMNFFENVTAVQFNHRMGAYAVITASVLLWIYGRSLRPRRRSRVALDLLLGATFLQFALGIATLIYAVPLWLAALHQAGALAAFAAAIFVVHSLRHDGVSAKVGANS